MIASGLVVCAIALPWLTLLPLHGVAAAIAHALTLIAAFHGAGRIVAWLAGRPEAAPLLVIQWGIAALIGLSGIAIACHAGTLAGHAVLVFGCVAIHTAALGLGFSEHVERLEAVLAGPRIWLVPAALLAVLGAIAVLGAAGDSFAQPFDGDGHLMAQLHRVLGTGALMDPIGYPRHAGLGGQVALAAIASSPGDDLPHGVEPLAAALALGLAISSLRAREPVAALWAVVLVVAGFALPFAPYDPLPCWAAAGLIVALHHMLGDAEPAPLPLGILAGALVVLRHELAPVAAAAVAAGWWRRPRDPRRAVVLLGGVLAVALPFVIARTLAWRSIPALSPPLLSTVLLHVSRAPLAVRALAAAAIAVPAALVLRLALPDHRALAAAATTTAVGLGAIVAHLAGTGGAGSGSLRLLWPVGIAFAITLVVELARSRWSGPAALLVSLGLCVTIYEAGEAPGHLRWSRRMTEAATGIDHLARPPGDAGDPYAPLLAGVRPGATVAVWVAEPERLDYARHRILDLRTPAGARLREHRFRDHISLAAALLGRLGADYLLLEADDLRVLRIQSDLIYRWLCREPRPICDDDLEAVARAHRVIAERNGVRLVDLGRGPAPRPGHSP
jgi:hypothetical protein